MPRNNKRRRRASANVGNVSSNSYYTNRILELFMRSPYQFYNYRQISSQLSISDKSEKELVKKTMEEMYQNHLLVEGNRGKYRLNPIHISVDESKILEGRIDIKQTGKGYLISDNAEIEDVFIAANNLGKALNGDIVRVHLFPARRGKHQEGRVIEVLRRKRELFVGTIQPGKNISYFIPDDTSMPVDILIPNQCLKGAKQGQKVVAAITDWDDHAKNPFGEVRQVLGFPGDNNVEMQAILIDQSFALEFSHNARQQAESIPTEIPQSEILRRKDFRSVFTMTVDPADAKDFDDAISFQKIKDRLYQIGVHIADVSYYIKENTPIDKEAYDRATSVYLVDRTYPMLPEKLCNQVCSLRPNEDKLCFSVVFQIDEKGKIYKQWIGKTVINSNCRFSYEQVQDIIEQKKGLYCQEILTLDTIAKALREDRIKKGTINFSSEEVKFILDDSQKPIGVYVKESKDANQLIEDFMLLANRKVAELIAKVDKDKTAKTFVYRVHDKPMEEKIGKFTTFINKLGYSLRTSSRKGFTDSINQLFDEVRGKGSQYMVENLALRTMQRAIYSTNNIGHYGLGFKYYTHFTSPIRRYPDLMVHRLLEAYLNGADSFDSACFEEKCKHCSDMEQRATEAERNSVKYFQSLFLADKVGQQFDGIISGVSKWGLWVQLNDTKCEGMVSVKTLTDDFYYYDEENYRYIGQHTGTILQLGMPVRIAVKNVNLAKKQMDFIFVK